MCQGIIDLSLNNYDHISTSLVLRAKSATAILYQRVYECHVSRLTDSGEFSDTSDKLCCQGTQILFLCYMY